MSRQAGTLFGLDASCGIYRSDVGSKELWKIFGVISTTSKNEETKVNASEHRSKE